MSEPITTVVLKNRSGKPIVLKREKSGLDVLINPFSAMGLKVHNKLPFLAIDWESRTVWYDFGSED